MECLQDKIDSLIKEVAKAKDNDLQIYNLLA
jgi:hypothetical protein